MIIDDLTIGEAKELASLFGNNSVKQSSLRDRYIGKYVICRTRNEGVNAGKVLALDETGVILEDARRLYYHKPINKNVSWYEGVAKDGVSSDSRLGVAIEKIISEDYSLTVCTDVAEKSIRGAKDSEQS
ncbi:MAG: hypothetical protein V3V81_07470 [Candidatus Bathyarchaeia archaeon]